MKTQRSDQGRELLYLLDKAIIHVQRTVKRLGPGVVNSEEVARKDKG